MSGGAFQFANSRLDGSKQSREASAFEFSVEDNFCGADNFSVFFSINDDNCFHSESSEHKAQDPASSEEMKLRSFMQANRSNPAYWSITECHQILKSRHRPLASNSTTATPSRARRGSGSPGLRASWLVPVEDTHMANISSDVTW